MTRLAGDLSLAEDCAQEALAQWPREGLPANPGGWLVAVARRRALDHLRRESARTGESAKPCKSGPLPSRTAVPSPETTNWRCCLRAAGIAGDTHLARRVRTAAIAVAYAEGPAAGLAILDTLAAGSQLARWPQLHIARATLLDQCGRREDAAAAYRNALALEPAEPVRQHVTGQIAALGAAPTLTEGT